MPVVQMPDGTHVNFPDDMPPEQIKALILRKFPDAGGPTAPQANDSGGILNSASHAVGDVLDYVGNAGGALIDKAADAATFGLAPRAAALLGAGLSHVTPGPVQSYDQALAAEQERQQQESEASPVASAAGSAVGTLAGGEGALRGAANVAERVAPGMVKAARKILTLKSGQAVKNIGRLAASGAAAGATYGGIQGAVNGAENAVDQGDVTSAPLDVATGGFTGALEGGATGAAVGPFGAAAVRGAAGVKNVFSNVSKRAITVLAKRLDMTPQQVMRQMADFKTSTGHAPSIADILDAKSVANLRDIPNTFQNAGVTAQEATEKRVGELPQRLSAAVEATGPTAELSKLRLAQNAAMNNAMDPIRATPVPVLGDDVGLLADPRIASVAREDPELKRKLGGMLEHLTDANGNVNPNALYTDLNVTDFENLREGLRGRQRAFLAANRPVLAKQYGQLSDDVAGYAANRVDAYGKALDEFEKHAQFIAGFQHGASGKPLNAVGDLGDIQTLQSGPARQGLEVGARSRLAQQAASSESGAVRTADEMRQSAGLNDRLTEAMGSNPAGAIRALGAAESKGVRNLTALTPSNLASKSDEQAQMTQQILESAAAAGGHVLTGFRVHAVQRLLNRVHIRPATAQKVVEMLVNPSQSQKAIRLLRNARVDSRKLYQILSGAAQASGLGGAALATSH